MNGMIPGTATVSNVRLSSVEEQFSKKTTRHRQTAIASQALRPVRIHKQVHPADSLPKPAGIPVRLLPIPRALFRGLQYFKLS